MYHRRHPTRSRTSERGDQTIHHTQRDRPFTQRDRPSHTTRPSITHNETIQHINQIYPDRQDESWFDTRSIQPHTPIYPATHTNISSHTDHLSIHAINMSRHAPTKRRPIGKRNQLPIINLIKQTSDHIANRGHETIFHSPDETIQSRKENHPATRGDHPFTRGGHPFTRGDHPITRGDHSTHPSIYPFTQQGYLRSHNGTRHGGAKGRWTTAVPHPGQ